MENKKLKLKSQSSIVNCQMFQRGFTLIELLIAMLIFSLVIVIIAGVFSSFLKNYAETKKVQKNVENAEYVMNLMAKTIRTSEVTTTPAGIFPNSFMVFDYSQAKCIDYKFDSSAKKIQMRTSDGTMAESSLADCSGANFSVFSDLTSDYIVAANVDATASDPGGTPPTYGKVTISLEVQAIGQTSKSFPIQMSVSLRQ